MRGATAGCMPDLTTTSSVTTISEDDLAGVTGGGFKGAAFGAMSLLNAFGAGGVPPDDGILRPEQPSAMVEPIRPGDGGGGGGGFGPFDSMSGSATGNFG